MRCYFLALYFILLLSSTVKGTEFFAPKDFPTIQKSINNCNHNDNVTLSPGVYTGNGNREIVFNGKRVIVRSVNPDDSEIVKTTVVDYQRDQSLAIF